jgi:hypothetical protein
VIDKDQAIPRPLDDFLERLDAAMEGLPQSSPGEPAGTLAPEDPVNTGWPSSDAAPRGSETTAVGPAPWRDPALDEELVDRVAARVLERIAEGIVRDTVSRVMSPIAERVVRQELERAKVEIGRS